MFKVHLNLSYESGINLKKEQLPVGTFEILPAETDPKKAAALSAVIEKFNNFGDFLLTDVFSALYGDRSFHFDVIYTSGAPAPYDAWTVSNDGKPVVYFNLSEWTVDELSKQ